MKGFILMTVLLLLEIHSLKADGADESRNAAGGTSNSRFWSIQDSVHSDSKDEFDKSARWSNTKVNVDREAIRKLVDEAYKKHRERLNMFHNVQNTTRIRISLPEKKQNSTFRIGKIIAVVIGIICGIASCYKARKKFTCKKKKRSVAADPEEAVPAMSSEPFTEQPNQFVLLHDSNRIPASGK